MSPDHLEETIRLCITLKDLWKQTMHPILKLGVIPPFPYGIAALKILDPSWKGALRILQLQNDRIYFLAQGCGNVFQGGVTMDMESYVVETHIPIDGKALSLVLKRDLFLCNTAGRL